MHIKSLVKYLLILAGFLFLAACDSGTGSGDGKPKSSDKLLSAFWFSAGSSVNSSAGITADVNAVITGNEISVTLPFGVQASSLAASFMVSGDCSVSVNQIAQVSGSTVNSFVSPVVYKVMAADGASQSYTVTVNSQWIKTIGTDEDNIGSLFIDKHGNIYSITTYRKILESGEIEKKGPFLKKYSPEFMELWSKKLPEQNYYYYNMSVDDTGNIYICGKFLETIDFDPGVQVDNKTASGDSDGFVTKFQSDGSYAWTKSIGSNLIWMKDEAITKVITDSEGSIYYTGNCYAPADFDPGTGVDIQAPLFSMYNAPEYTWIFQYLTKLNSDGSYDWTRITKQGYGNSIDDLAADSGNNVYIAGFLRGATDFDPGIGVDLKEPKGWGDAYSAKFRSDGTYDWAKSFGGEGTDIAKEILTDHKDNIYISGFFSGTVDFDIGAGTDFKTDSGYGDCPYISKYNYDGSYVWTKVIDLETGGFTVLLGTVTDTSGNIYAALDLTSFEPRKTEIKILKIRTDGTSEWIRTVASSGEGMLFMSDYFSIDNHDNIYMSGSFSGTINVSSGSETIQKTSSGESDLFVFKLHP